MSTTLSANTIYIVVYFRPSPPGDPFHWGLVLKTQDAPNGLLYHASLRPGWTFLVENKPFESSFSSVMATKIGQVPPGTTSVHFKTFLDQVSVGSNQYASANDWDCKCWVRDAVQLLHNKGGIRCNNVEALLQEISTAALPLKPGVERGTGKYGIRTTNLSK
ncbi:hypothetical protein BDZ97DRAFT_1851867 [Flammula alnicola]|nr:hypothetical protein BDZ97DRAFT_1763817 [Flammula alnicola]KAF8956420.1 hypothetical protein BDZ97DRAFT_1851867 [Flammula alnicola]